MKTNPSRLHTVAALFAGIIAVYAAHTANAQRINPATGLPASGTANAPRIDPATGLPVLEPGNLPPGATTDNIATTTAKEVHGLIASGQYEDALQRCLSFQRQLKGDQTLTPLLSDWVELGRRLPKARQSLIEIRDRDARAFARDQGTFKLFQELCDLNDALGDDEATIALFKGIRQNHPSQAEEWYLFVEPVLVRHGEYQLCLECIGNPQTRFNVYCYTFRQLQALYEGMSERSKETRRKMEEFNQQPDRPPLPSYPQINTGEMGLKNTRDNYANEVRRLIEILVGTGHQEEAAKIRNEAVAVLDDPRLQSAVRDAEEKVQKRSTRQ
jgi:hypothetical protein